MASREQQRRTIRKAKAKASTPEKADLAVAEALLPFRNSAPAQWLEGAGEFGDQPPLYAATGAVMVTGLALGDWKLTRAGARMVGAHVAAIAIKNIVKTVVDRTRPNVIDEQDDYQLHQGRHSAHDYTSFPSGHTASSVAVARALARDYPGASTAALGAAAGIGAAQIGASRHYVGDVVAGIAIGVIADALVDLIFQRFPARDD